MTVEKTPTIEYGTGWAKIHFRRDLTDEDRAFLEGSFVARSVADYDEMIRHEQQGYYLWQERAPYGDFFVKTPYGEIGFGRDGASARECLNAFTKLADELIKKTEALAEATTDT